MKPTNDAYLAHIRDAITAVETYAKTHVYQQFLDLPWDQAAVVRHLEIIGEAAAHVSVDFKAKYPEIPWRRISDFRNVLTHEYFAVDPLLVWEIIEKDLPILKTQIKKLLDQERHSV
ncbi:hypothetical protein A3A64_00465 [Candidatus Gottesmanbacteria bacterium RIFCSPLOWO2_01_FULL_48_11]|uniref:Nucleotidyltransferase n=2 Tax=Candidatus Gottesmaniibacteriota TaxID=1752720 RepID=A0A0G1U013_9BACT|nr:MAG: hypothetical protein UY16_C0028G0010 [Candidatus Gottesmanbacteria bacterium GW2011_GWA2_47_9]OGG27979.1 MAG: hypothetical protein A3A64_00465 [Candidatus Gottesmanbacteria bacterium RIFCSPLOWO2_01_FULL_48_11]HAR39202.1 hypothetical protein [Porphyromonadaceae bacterium]